MNFIATSGWDVVTAIGTLAAAVVALGIALAPAIIGRFRRPRVEFEVGHSEPHCVTKSDAERTIARIHFRVAVRNSGRSDLDRAWVTLGKRWKQDLPIDDDLPDRISKPAMNTNWILWSDEPINLRWSTHPGEITTIAEGQVGYIELAVLDVRQHHLTISAVRPSDVIGGVNVPYPRARHRWEFLAGGHRSGVQRRVIEFLTDGKNFISGVTMTEAPSIYDQARILSLLDQVEAEVSRKTEVEAEAWKLSGGDEPEVEETTSVAPRIEQPATAHRPHRDADATDGGSHPPS